MPPLVTLTQREVRECHSPSEALGLTWARGLLILQIQTRLE